MTDELYLSPDLSLPTDAQTQTFAILAKRGVGKTYTMLVMAEEMFKRGLQFVIADPIGVCHGLRSSADGKHEGLPVIILGGEHGDVPLEVTAGETISDFVIESGQSCVLDLSLFRKGEQVRFMTDFAERLYHRNRAPLHLFLDEADAFAPQRPMPGEQRMLGAVEDLVRRGRARGIGVTLVTQRAAVLNKDVLTQVEVLIALRTIAPQDRSAVDAWVKAHGSEDEWKQMEESLPSLPIGTAWFWSPGWLDVFKKVRIRKRETFDSSATPKAGTKAAEPKQRAEVDLAALRDRIAATIERKKSEDPRELHKQITELRRQLDTAQAQKPAPQIVEKPVLDKERLQGLADMLSQFNKDTAAIAAALSQVAESINRATTSTTPSPRPAPSLPLPSAPRTKAPAKPTIEDESGEVTAPQQRILNTLATFESLGVEQAERGNVAVFSDQSPTSSGYTNNLGRLKSLGLIEYPTSGMVRLTAEGRARAESRENIRTQRDLHAAWFNKLSRPKARILQVLIEQYPNAVDKVMLAGLTAQSPTSSGYTNNLGSLRSLGLIDYPSPGYVVATDLLFPSIPER